MDATIEIQSKIIELIRQTQNLDVLQKIESILSESKDTVYELSDAQLETVREAELEIKNGNVKNNDEVFAELHEWLSKQ